MQVYLYAKSGHTIGLDQTKQCAAIAHYLEDLTPILCTSDFRAGAFAKELLGVKKYVNIDVVRNLPNIMNRKDILLYKTDEANEIMNEGMNNFCSLVFNLDEFKNPIVDKKLYKKTDANKIEKTFFFGDDDYYNQLIGLVENLGTYDMQMLMGHYFFLGNEKAFEKHFTNIIDEEEYVETIINTNYLLTTSLQSAYESLASGNKPVLLKRKDKTYDEKQISNINIPVIQENSLDIAIKKFDEIVENYPDISLLNIEDFESLKNQILEKVNHFNKISNT
jgi:hypothetical protein